MSVHKTEPDTVEQWLKNYDAGLPVTSVCMGGMGMGYELVIQDVAVAFMRGLVAAEPFGSIEEMKNFCVPLGAKIMLELNHHGMTGAQFSAGRSIALNFHRRHPAASLGTLKDESRLLTLQLV